MSLSAVSATFSLPPFPLFSTRTGSGSHSRPLSRSNASSLLKGSSNRIRVSVSSITSLSQSSSRTSSNSVLTIPYSAASSSPLARTVAPDDMHDVQDGTDMKGSTVSSSVPLGSSAGTNPALSRKTPSSPSSSLASSVTKPRRQQSKGESLPGPREAALADALARALTPEDAVTALEEYAWRSLKAGIRVREYCNAADNTVQMCPPRGIRISMSLLHTPVGLLYPFCLTPGSLVAGTAPPPLPLTAIGHLSKKNLSEALIRIAREPNEAVGKAHVLELAIEYVGRRWREGDCNFVDAIAKKFVEVHTELHAACGTETVVIPTFDLFRYQFGFVDTQQLISLLSKSVFATADPTELVKAWAVRRLAAGAEPQVLASDLYYIRGHLNIQSRRDAVNKVFSSLALDGREAATQWTPLDSSRSRNRSGSRLSLSRGSKRKTMAIPWLAKLQYDDRRPSLPTHLSAAEPSPTGWSRLGAFGASTTDFSPGAPSATMTRNGSLGMSLIAMSTSNLGSPNSLGLSDLSGDIRSALADHLLFLRYRLGPDADGWTLGGGRDKAVDFLEHLETKDETKAFVQELRKVFDIPPREVARKLSAFHERDVSFDLDQYIADIGPQGDEDEVTPSSQSNQPPVSYSLRRTNRRKEVLRRRRASLSSIATATTSMSSLSMSISTLGDFTICEATRVPMTAKEAEFRFSEPSPVTADVCKPTPEPRFAQSMANLVRRKSSESSESSSATPRRMGRISTAPTTPLMPAFEEQVPAKKRQVAEFPSFTPPLSPTASLDAPLDSPLPPQKNLRVMESRPRSRTMEGRRAAGGIDTHRRHQFRQYVIVDGEQLVPDSERTTTPVKTTARKVSTNSSNNPTPLGSILALFNNLDLTSAQVETKLTDMIAQEARNAAEKGHNFEAEAKARVIWLLEQVVLELVDLAHVAAAERVLKRLNSCVAPLTPPTHLKAPSVEIRKANSPGRRDLTIKVPPRGVRILALEQNSPAAAFASSSSTLGPCSPQRTSPVTPRSPLNSHDGDDDVTPLRPTYEQGTPTSPRPLANPTPPTLSRNASGSWQALRRRSQSHSGGHPMVRSPSGGNFSSPSAWSSPLKKSPSTSSPNRPGIFRKPATPLSAIPPMPPLPPLPRTPVNVGTF